MPLTCAQLKCIVSSIFPQPVCPLLFNMARNSDAGQLTCSGGRHMKFPVAEKRIPVSFIPAGPTA